MTITNCPEYRNVKVKEWHPTYAHICYDVENKEKQYADVSIEHVQLPNWKPTPERWREWATRYCGCYQASDPAKQLKYEMRQLRLYHEIRGRAFEDEQDEPETAEAPAVL